MRLQISILMTFGMLFVACKEERTKKIDTPSEVQMTQVEASTTSDYQDLEGNAIDLADYKGKKVLLNFWATWCRPCIEEMPSLMRSQEILSSENYIFLLASDQSVKKTVDFIAAHDFDFNFIKFNGSLAELQINALPVTFIYNEAGEQVERITGAIEWDAPEMIERLKAIE